MHLLTRLFSWILIITGVVLPTEHQVWQHPSSNHEPFTTLFSAPTTAYGPGHRGIDFHIARGNTLTAPVDGVVHFSGTVADRPLITIKVNDHVLLTLEPVESELREGEAVKRGEVIGTVSKGGHCAATCVHIGVRIKGVYVNPLRFFIEKPVLLPYGHQ